MFLCLNVAIVAEIAFNSAGVGNDGVYADHESGDAVRAVSHKSPNGYEVKGLSLHKY